METYDKLIDSIEYLTLIKINDLNNTKQLKKKHEYIEMTEIKKKLKNNLYNKYDNI